jgi:hypothetical protein
MCRCLYRHLPAEAGKGEIGARAARNVLASRNRDVLAAHRQQPRGAVHSRRRLGREKRTLSGRACAVLSGNGLTVPPSPGGSWGGQELSASCIKRESATHR